MSNTLNLFPARVPIGLAQPDGTVLMTPEFMRAMRALFQRVGGAEGLDSDDLAILAASVAQVNSAQSQAVEDIDAVTSPDFSGQVAALLAEVQELRIQANQVDLMRAELAEIRNELEGIQLVTTFQDPYRLDLTRPGPIGSQAPNTGAFTTLSASGQITSTLATGTAPFSVASTTQVSNLNVSQLEGKTWEVPGTIGSTIPNTGRFTTVGVGTATPTYRFVVSNSGAQGIEFDSDGAAYGAGTTGILAYNRSSSAYIPLNVTGLTVNLRASGTIKLTIDGTGIGFYGGATVAKPTVTGSRGGNAALASLLTSLASQGLVTDSSTA